MSASLLDRPSALPEGCAPALIDLLVALADNKHVLGLRYGEWCSSGPTVEAGVAATAMAQDELGHARVLYGLLEDLPGAPRRSEHEWIAADARTVALLDEPFPTWPHLIVANVLLDRALALVLETALRSRYLPLRQRVRKVLDEEQYHAIHGQGWLLHLAAEGPPVRACLEPIVRSAWLDAFCWFGPDDGGALRRLVETGVLEEAGAPVRQRWLGVVGPLLRDAAIAAPVRVSGPGWMPAEPPPWLLWDERTRRVRRAPP